MRRPTAVWRSKRQNHQFAYRGPSQVWRRADRRIPGFYFRKRRAEPRLRGCWFRGAACYNPPKHTSKTPAHSAPPRSAPPPITKPAAAFVRLPVWPLQKRWGWSMSIMWEREKCLHVDKNLVKKICAAAVGGGVHHDGRNACRLRGGGRSRCSCVVDRHHEPPR